MVLSTLCIPLQSVSTSRYSRLRSFCLILLNAPSMGLRSGEYGGWNPNFASAVSVSSRTRAPL